MEILIQNDMSSQKVFSLLVASCDDDCDCDCDCDSCRYDYPPVEGTAHLPTDELTCARNDYY